MNMSTKCILHALAFLTIVWVAPEAHAGIVLPDLPAGTIYQLVFVTNNGTEAYLYSSPVGANYSVQISANQNPDLPETSWKAVASFGANASVNAPVYESVPIYNLAGQLVATGTEFYSSTHLAPIGFNQFGDLAARRPWTGMHPNGAPRDSINPWAASITCGYSLATDGRWASESLSYNSLERRSWYGLSGQLVAVPEPTACLTASVFVGWIIRLSRVRYPKNKSMQDSSTPTRRAEQDDGRRSDRTGHPTP